MAGKFILDRVKKHFGDDDKDYSDGFPDMNYLIGASTGMDVGEFPTPMDERIGYAAMVGGKVMELQITNPATFTLERDQMISTIHQLGLDVTTHPDMNAGFCTAEKSARGEEYGYDTIEQYFTDYLQELAQFKKHVEKLGKDDEPLFNIGRMNPHISTSPMPALNERMANDVGVDPFGYEINDITTFNQRDEVGQNIYRNQEFLKKMYRSFLLEVYDQKWRIYENFISRNSPKFKEIWRDAQRRACNDLYLNEVSEKDLSNLNTNQLYERLEDQIALVSTAGRADVGIQNEWLSLLEDEFEGGPVSLNVDIPEQQLQDIVDANNPIDNKDEARDQFENLIPDSVKNLEKVDEFLPQTTRLTSLNTLPEALYRINKLDFQIRSQEIGRRQNLTDMVSDESLRKLKRETMETLSARLNKLWLGNGENFLISVEGKRNSLTNHLDYDGQQILQLSEDYSGETRDKSDKFEELDEAASLAFSGRDDFFKGEEEREKPHLEMLRTIFSQFEREIWKESSIFYKILPCWMTSCDTEEYDGHNKFEAPSFIWETIIESNWSDYNLNLEKPRESDYFELLENSKEFQRDVAAAVGACYAWGHFTQRKSKFDLKDRDFGLSDEEAEEVQREGWTWVRWMNKFGLGVNLETMQGSPQMRFKVWRPKDIAVTAHAINLTTREMFDEEELNDEIDGRPAKFTIDMEHVASLGAPPLDEMKRFWKQEERLAGDRPELGLDEEKPVSTILRQMHLMDPGVEGQRGTHHGSFERGNMLLYEWLYKFVKHGFARNENEPATVLFELAEHNDESSYMMRITMNLIELGVKPEDLDPNRVDPGEEPEDEEEALIARFFGMEQVNYSREWAKIEQHAFDPLQGLLEAEEFDYTYSSKAAIENDVRPAEFGGEEYK